MKTLGEVLQLSTQFLEKKKTGRARRLCEELLAHVLKLKRIELYMQLDRPLYEQELVDLRELLARKAKGEPIQYILKELSFFHCSLEVSSEVLIPRQETEILLDNVVSELRERDLKAKVAWDLCCGSGCLGIALKKAYPELNVILGDISKSALEIAKKNSERNFVDLLFYEGDFLEPFKGEKADFILCNPPYISEGEYLSLDREVRDFEPRLALVGGPTGLEFYARLARELSSFLNPQAKIFLEIGATQGDDVLALFKESYWKNKRIKKDWSGRDRFFFLEIE